MNNVFNITFEFEGNQYEATVTFSQPIGDSQYHVNIKDPALIERFQNNFIFTDKAGELTYPSDPAGFMKSIAEALKQYILDNKIIPDTTAGFYETS
jgi:hypothetical protein